MVLSITVQETIGVQDIIEQVFSFIKKIVQLFVEPDEPEAEVEAEEEDNKSPPTLGINVSDGVGTQESIG